MENFQKHCKDELHTTNPQTLQDFILCKENFKTDPMFFLWSHSDGWRSKAKE